MILEKLEGFDVKFKQKKPIDGFRYPVFLDDENKVFYYVIEKPTYVIKDKVEYKFKNNTEEPENGIEYVAIAKDMMDKFAKSLDAEKLFMMLKGPELNYVKGYVFDLKKWKEDAEKDRLKIYIGDYISNRNHNFKSHMFLTSEMHYIKQEEKDK